MNDYTFFMPTKVVSGIGKAKETGELLKGYQARKVFVVTDKGIVNTGILNEIIDSLHQNGMESFVFDEVEPNPNSELIVKATRALRENQCGLLLAVGGGSSIDTAKAAAVMAKNKGAILDYEGVGKIPEPPLPVAAIPTTAGTGSEVTNSTVITNEKTLFKAAVVSEYLFPDLAVLDPQLSIGCPAGITASTGMDALTHGIESYVSKNANPISRALAIRSIKMIGENIEKAYFSGTDMTSRINMLEASMMAGFAFSQSRLGAVHAISQSFGGVFNIPHGIANSVLLPYVIQFNLPACLEQMKDIADALGADTTGMNEKHAAEQVLERVITLNASLQIPNNIKDLGVSMEQLPKLVQDSMASGNVIVNPRLINEEQVQKLIEDAYHGNL
ncbi:iron-containing alcohol dehydrogenase [Alteribacillus sp. HJP-4]|uniref:iron-containing alcohol dehydrogenase n=1 Tax=Alteribacillus sp. HJP-4 TaxID=2775394 RepID=UPI0035CD1DB6